MMDQQDQNNDAELRKARDALFIAFIAIKFAANKASVNRACHSITPVRAYVSDWLSGTDFSICRYTEI
jgi:hypothetical protein